MSTKRKLSAYYDKIKFASTHPKCAANEGVQLRHIYQVYRCLHCGAFHIVGWEDIKINVDGAPFQVL